MNFLCINADDMFGVLTKGKIYKGEYARHLDVVKIFRADDGKPGYVDGKRLQVVEEYITEEPVLRIYNYTIDVEKK